jgi:endonuclease/exonuclease/phosphatase family metal-dependent hydrolase
MFEDFGLRNLVKEYGVISTRTHFYTKPEKFADYIFVLQGIDVKDFRVLPDAVSDHSPLYLEFE